MDHKGTVDFEYLILGAGPAGLQLGHHLSRAGRSYLILERGESPGELFLKHPRHRTLISSNKVYTGCDNPEVNSRFDWNSLLSDDAQLPFRDYSTLYFPPADTMVRYLCDYAECFALNLRCGAEVVRVERLREGFRLTDSAGNAFTGLRLVVAAGLTQPQVPGAAGEAEDLFRFDNSFFDRDCRPELTINDRFPSLTCEWESTNVPGMYFAGTLTQSRDFRKTASGLIHGFRYNTRALFRMLEARYHARPWPAREVTPTVDGVLDSMVSRLNTSSALWQQHGFLHDLIVMPESGGPALHLEELPLAYVQESELSLSSHYYTVSMELGAIEGDPFAAVRWPGPEAAHEDAFLHPVVRRWNGPLLVAEHHLLENLNGEWTREDLHLSPLREFLREQMRERVRILTDWN